MSDENKKDKSTEQNAVQRHIDKFNKDREAREARKQKHRKEKDKSAQIKQISNFRELSRKLNPTKHIPYEVILGEDGHLGYHMSLKIKKRKQEIMDEMSKILKVEEKFPERFKDDRKEKTE